MNGRCGQKRTVFLYILIVAGLLVLTVLNFMIGTVKVEAADIIRCLFGDSEGTYGTIITQIRFPRIVAAIMLGGALSLSGYLLQAFFANPIAGPFVLGISSGAKLAVALLMVFSLSAGLSLTGSTMVLAALVGAGIATAFVIFMAGRIRNMSILIICGVMIGYICSAITELIVSFADDSNIVNLHNWSMGSFSAIDWEDAKYYIPIVILCFLVSVLMSKSIEAFSFGESYAVNLGINVKLFRIMLIVTSSILSATVTAFAGPISFVGIAVPHIVRELFKTTKPIIMITATFLMGSVFVLLCDLLARSIFAPTELSISTITAIFGAPIVISLLVQRKRTR